MCGRAMRSPRFWKRSDAVAAPDEMRRLISMSKRDLVFVDIDTQFDFMDKGGSLYVPGAEEIVPNLRKLISFAKDRSVPVVASVDAHPADDPEFAQFPPHCVRDTPGQLKIGATVMAPSVVVPESERDFALPES